MSTASYIVVKDFDGKILLRLYKHYDSGLDVLGKQMFDAFGNVEIGVAANWNYNLRVYAAGMGCFAAQLVMELKKHVGDLHVDTEALPYDENYGYIFTFKDNALMLKAIDPGKVVFNDAFSKFGEFLKTYKEKENDSAV